LSQGQKCQSEEDVKVDREAQRKIAMPLKHYGFSEVIHFH